MRRACREREEKLAEIIEERKKLLELLRRQNDIDIDRVIRMNKGKQEKIRAECQRKELEIRQTQTESAPAEIAIGLVQITED